jgi:hypothetical protein
LHGCIVLFRIEAHAPEWLECVVCQDVDSAVVCF